MDINRGNKKDLILIVSLIFILFILNYNSLDNALENFLENAQTEIISVDRIIDGDTIESNGTSIRLLGINSPERGEPYFNEAKNFLEELIFNETIQLEFVGQKQDKYYRSLGYLHYKGENINIKMVENGLANYYFFDGRDKYSDDLEIAWNSCLEKEINLCKPSEHICSECIEINGDRIINQCGFSCNINGWEIKSEGRDKVVLNGTLGIDEGREFDLDLSDSGGSLFLRDAEGGLVSWKNG
ncbi:MAG: thermonuclease family protein [Candidatus Pacearchaeota archaeon]